MKRTLGIRKRFVFVGLSILSSAFVFVGCKSSAPPPDTTPPSTPANLVSTVISSTQINLTWTASTDNVGVTGYKVERCQGGGCSNFSQITTTTNTNFSDTGLTPSTSYSYRVRATDAAGNLSGYSNAPSGITAAAAISVSITPVRGGAVMGQSVTFTAPVQNDVGAAGVTWATSGGAFSSQNTTSATLTAPNSTGNVTVTATSVADNTKSASATIAITDLAGVTTYHNDLARDGANTHEFALTPANVNTSTFVKLFSCAVDGAIYAQPLWVPQITVNGAKHNVVFVATQHDSVYAFDADASPCATLWHFSLLDAAHGGGTGAVAETSVPASPPYVGSGFGDITPEVGITGTSVIDPATNTIYVVTKSVIPNSSPLAFFQRLHALDLVTGNEKFGGPLNISATVPGNGDGSSGGMVPFDPGNEHQRSGLALNGGFVYVAWASHEDHSPYHGWVIAYGANLSQQAAVFNTSPNSGLSGIWMSGAAPAFDNSGNIYFSTGNGTFDTSATVPPQAPNNDFGDSVLKLAPPNVGALPLLDFFTPFDQSNLNAGDVDVAAGGVVLLPNLSTGKQILVQVGKDGTIHVLDRSNLGQYCNGCASDTQIVQEIQGQVNGMWGTPAYWNGNLYVGGAQDGGTSGDNLKAFSFSPALSQPLSAAPTSLSSHVYNFSGPTPSVSANGTTNGIVWAIDNSQYGPPTPNGSGPAVLHAYDATNLASELWNSSQVSGDIAGNAVKFTVPTIANGKVYVGTRGSSTTNGGVGELDVYGLKPN